MVEGQNLTIFVNTDIFEIISGGNLSVITITQEIPRSFERRWLNSDTSKTVATYIFKPQSIEFDWLGQNIYWMQLDLLEAGDINGIYRKTLYHVPFGHYLALDPNTG